MMSDEQRHLDVKAGHEPVAHTSRPIIVGRQQLTHDPMMKHDDNETTATKPADDQPEEKPHKEQNIEPPKQLIKEQAEERTTKENVTSNSATSETDDGALPESVVEQTKQSVMPAQADKAAELIANKNYQLPIHQTPAHRIVKVVIVFVIVLILAAAIAYFMTNR